MSNVRHKCLSNINTIDLRSYATSITLRHHSPHKKGRRMVFHGGVAIGLLACALSQLDALFLAQTFSTIPARRHVRDKVCHVLGSRSRAQVKSHGIHKDTRIFDSPPKDI